MVREDRGMSLARRLVLLPSMVAIGLLVLAGCATSGVPGPASTPSVSAPPSATNDPIEGELGAAWLDGGRMIGLVTVGSSTCPPVAQEVILQDDGTLSVALGEMDDDVACTSDLAPRVTLIDVPDGVDPAEDLDIAVTGEGYSGGVELQGVDGLASAGMTDYLPSAGWTDIDDAFVVLTWGSSSCAPVVETVTATGPAEVTIVFATPSADQICTMDMAPRAVVAMVSGLDDSDVSVVLDGDEFAGERVPIYGDN
jgi:hypothetical protein